MKLEFISARGEVLPLSHNNRFKLSHVDGITLTEVDISTTTNPTIDGDIVNNTRVIARPITLDISIEREVESTARYILRYIKTKMKGTLRRTQDGRTMQISGIVESISLPRFTSAATMQISMHCSQPFWEDIENTSEEIAEVLDLFYFTDKPDDMLYFPEEGIAFGEIDMNRTKVLTNEGDAAVGMEIHITALNTVKNPIIYNSDGQYFGVDITLQSGDEIIITTGKGNKTLTLNGANIISKRREGSTWLQLELGENEFTIDSEDGTEGNMYFTVVYKQRYI